MNTTLIKRARALAADMAAGRVPAECPYDRPELIHAWAIGQAMLMLPTLADALERAERAPPMADRTPADITRRLAGLADGLANSNSAAERAAAELADEARAWVRAQDGAA